VPLTRSQLTWIAAAALLLGSSAAVVYYLQDLTLSHYDAKAHLVVARRIVDSLRPGWWQIGAVWLPLPHLLNLGPVQVDWLYRTGLSGVAISVASFTVTVTTIAWLIGRATGSLWAALAGALVFAAQPDVLYLQATPMTEPLLMALCVLGVALTWRWVQDDDALRPHAASLALAGACLTRYEAWPVTAATVGLAGLVLLMNGKGLGVAIVRTWRLATYPIVAVIAFLCLSRATVGAWLVTGGFYLVDNPAHHRPITALGQVFWGLRQLDGTATVVMALIAAAGCLIAVARSPRHRALLVLFALTGTAALPTYAFYNGHPFRIRYMVVLTAAVAVMAGVGVGLLSRVAPRARLGVLAAALLAAIAIIETPPFPQTSPMLAEAQWDRPRSRERQKVTACLRTQYDGAPILASMGSLAHFMQETSRAGFNIRDYIHEGIGQVWIDSLEQARRHAGWVLIEEQAEGGDQLFHLRAQSPRFLDGFDRICEGGGVALYRRR